MQYRRLLEPDVEAYNALRIEMLREHPDAFGDSLEEHLARGIEVVKGWLGREAADHPESQVLGAFDGETLVGSVGLRRETHAKERHLGHIWGVYVRPGARGSGVGRELMRRALEALRGFGVEVAYLGVGAHNAGARKLYEAVGFVRTGVHPRALRVNGRDYDEEHMVCELRSRKA